MKSLEIEGGVIYPKTKCYSTYCSAIDKYVLNNFKSIDTLKFVLDEYMVSIPAENLVMTHYRSEYGISTFIEFAEEDEDENKFVFKIFEEFLYCFESDIKKYLEWYSSFITFTKLEKPITFEKF
jgi:hypothetical protein